MNGRVYYNDVDPFCAAWLGELMRAGLISEGEIDTRSIVDVRPCDLKGFIRCHFFAGIGGWDCALQLAGWPDDREVWTGSCPCQPLSSAGKRKGHADERHLWPAFHALIAEFEPATVFGEQVASKDGREWLAGVRADMEALGYAVGAADLCAAGVGAPHIRQRVWWVGSRLADTDGRIAGNGHLQSSGQYGQQPQDGGAVERLADAQCDPRNTGGIANEHDQGTRTQATRSRAEPGRCGMSGERMADSVSERGRSGAAGSEHASDAGQPSKAGWGGEFIRCADGKARRIEPTIFPLAHGISNRVGTLRGAGNAIVPQVGAEFIRAFLET